VSPEVHLRAARREDLASLETLLANCKVRMKAEGVDQWDDVYPTNAKVATDVETGSLYVAIDAHGDVIAAVTINDHQDPEYADVSWKLRPSRIGVVHRLMVRPSAQGRGVGEATMRLAEARARALGFEALRLDAFVSNPRSLRLYRRLGYAEVGGVTFRKGAFRCFEKDLRSKERQ
jgi:ribosomal protein S18 acetylase RimI-like enzyme